MKKMAKRVFLVFMLVIPFSSFRQALAQNIPPGQEPGAQAERFLKESKEKNESLGKKKAKAPALTIEEKAAPQAKEGISFVFNGIKLSGSTVFKAEDFRPDYSEYLGKKVAYSDLEQIIERIKARYKKKGYLTTSAYLPEQEIKEGIVEIRVIEGKMGNVKIEGNKYFLSAFIRKYIHVIKNQVLNVNTLQRDILRLNQNSDLTIKATLAQGEAPETSDITLTVIEKFPFHIGSSFDNQGTRLVGRLRGGSYLRASNLTGRGDSLFVNSVFSTLSFGQSVSYAIPVGTYGTKAGLDMTYFTTKLGKEYKAYDITGNTQIYTPRVSWELALTDGFQAYMDLGMDIKYIIKKTAGEKTSDDRLLLPYLGFNFTKNDAFGQSSFAPRFSGGTGNIFKYEQSLGRIQRMPFDSYLLMRSQFQVSSRALPSSEQFQLGGANSVRGYPEGDYSCDMGGIFSADWVMPMYLIPKKWQISGSDAPLRHQIEPVLFADIGGGDLKGASPGEPKNKFLASVGIGLRLHFNDNFSARLGWAKRIGDKPTGNSGPSTFYFTLQSEI